MQVILDDCGQGWMASPLKPKSKTSSASCGQRPPLFWSKDNLERLESSRSWLRSTGIDGDMRDQSAMLDPG
jgi:hypothetical protein